MKAVTLLRCITGLPGSGFGTAPSKHWTAYDVLTNPAKQQSVLLEVAYVQHIHLL